MKAPMGCAASNEYFFIGCKGMACVAIYRHDGNFEKFLQYRFEEPIGMTGKLKHCCFCFASVWKTLSAFIAEIPIIQYKTVTSTNDLIIQDGHSLVKFGPDLKPVKSFDVKATREAIGKYRTFAVVTFYNGRKELIGTFDKQNFITFDMDGNFEAKTSLYFDGLGDLQTPSIKYATSTKSGDILLSDMTNGVIWKLENPGTSQHKCSILMAPGVNGVQFHQINQIAGLCTDGKGNVLFCSSKTNRIFALNSEGLPMCTVDCIINPRYTRKEVERPADIVMSPDGKKVLVCSVTKNVCHIFTFDAIEVEVDNRTYQL